MIYGVNVFFLLKSLKIVFLKFSSGNFFFFLNLSPLQAAFEFVSLAV